MTKWQTNNTRTIKTGFNYEIREDTVTLPDGTKIPDFEYIHEPNAVVVLPFTENGEVIVIDEWRQIVRRNVNYGFPGGSIEPDEQPIEAANRELQEETGYEPETLTFLCESETTNGFTNGVHTFFIANGCTPIESGPNTELGEDINVRTEPFETVLNAVRTGEVRDSKTILPVLFYHTQNQ